MSKTVTVEFKRARYVWDGSRWYNEFDYTIPHHSMVGILEQLIPAEAHQEMMTDAHKEYLAASGLTRAGVERARKSSHRAAICPHCHRTEVHGVEIACARCHWIIDRKSTRLNSSHLGI